MDNNEESSGNRLSIRCYKGTTTKDAKFHIAYCSASFFYIDVKNKRCLSRKRH